MLFQWIEVPTSIPRHIWSMSWGAFGRYKLFKAVGADGWTAWCEYPDGTRVYMPGHPWLTEKDAEDALAKWFDRPDFFDPAEDARE